MVTAMKRQNFSRKREAILKAICSTNTHPTADWVYQQLKEQYPDLSLGTVYRNISLFKEAGLVISIGIVNGQERLDGNTIPHAHFICNTCGAVLDIDDMEIDNLFCQKISEKYHLKIDYQGTTFHGTCSHCLIGNPPLKNKL